MLIIDANAILRYILFDNEDMAICVDNLLKAQAVTIRYEVIAEVVYVLNKVYSMPKDEISSCIKIFLEQPNVIIDELDVLVLALETYGSINLDFVDSLLYSFTKIKECTVFTFDKRLNALIRKI